LFLVFFLVSAYFASLIIQSSLFQPASAKALAQDFKSVNIGFCVVNSVGNRWSIIVHDGELAKGAKGILASKATKFQQGDCLSARVQLSVIAGFSRFAFNGSLREVVGEIRHQESFSAVNAMRKFAGNRNGDPANLVSGLAIGLDQGLSKQFLVNMKSTGLTHLTAVSGANCAIVLGLFWLIAKFIGSGRNLRFVFSVLALGGYVTLVGLQPSVLRAAFMMTVVLAAFEFGRRVWIPAALGLGSAILLLIDPWLIADYGFWLSVLATLGLVLLTPSLSTILQAHLPKPIAIGLSATIAAQLWCLPLLVELQGGFTTYSVLANLLVEPAVPVITIFGLIGTLLGPLFPWLGSLMFAIASIPASWIVFVANSLSQGPYQLIELPTGALGLSLLSAFVLSTTWALIRRSLFPAILSGLMILVWIGLEVGGIGSKLSWPIINWSLVACDVGQGDSLIVRSNNKVAVIDVGKDPELVDRCLDRLGIMAVDLLVLTHFDLDHVGGISGAQRGREIKLALFSPFPDERPEAQVIVQEVTKYSNQVMVADVGLEGNLGEFNWQVISSLGKLAESANQGSLAIRFESSELVVYTLADLDEVAQEQAIGNARMSTKFTVVKVSHHGSADQSEKFYKRIDPDIALISVGKGNSYGHPTAKTLNMLAELDTKVFRTDLDGAISIALNKGVIEARVAGAR
jgi:competence protein ComEC